MNSLLPWIRFHNRSSGLWKDEKEGRTQEQPLGSGKPFRLKSLCKHVSDYEKSLTPEDSKEPARTSVNHFYGKRSKGDSAWEIGNLKVGKARTILDKAHQVNNKYFYPAMRLTC